MAVTVDQVVSKFDATVIGDATIAQVGGRNVVVVRNNGALVFVCVHKKTSDTAPDGFLFRSHGGAAPDIYVTGAWEGDFNA